LKSEGLEYNNKMISMLIFCHLFSARSCMFPVCVPFKGSIVPMSEFTFLAK